jgi:hypothetical protein
MQNLIKALVEASKYFEPIVKDKANPFHKSKYATLDSVLASVSPALFAHGLVLVQLLERNEDDVLVLNTQLWHTSGECLESKHPLPNIQDAQKMGIAITYARRYSVCAILSVVADEDTDAQTGKDGRTPLVGNTKGKAPTISQDQIDELTELATTAGYTLPEMAEQVKSRGFASRQFITVEAYPKLVELFSSPKSATSDKK